MNLEKMVELLEIRTVVKFKTLLTVYCEKNNIYPYVHATNEIFFSEEA